ncbi:MAG: response regulator, partial [Candidatus Sumerlaeia bacterium]|nr:response regulator [Candidatus Sumerlaeia bacterium]
PRLNGYQLFAQLKSDEKTKSIPILVVTALTQGSDLSDEDWARRMGAEGFLTKPFDLDTLGQRVNELVAAME